MTRIDRAALTNNPALDLVALAKAQQKEEIMDDIAAIRSALDLPEMSSIADLIAAIMALKKKPKAQAAREGDQEVQSYVAELARERLELHTARINHKVGEAMRRGVFPPSLRDWGLRLARADERQFDEFVEKVGAPFGALSDGKLTAEADALERQYLARERGHSTHSGAEEAVARQLGIDPKNLL